MKALAASSVKVKGVDVIASHKVLCAIVAFPIASVIWTLAFRYELKYLFDITGSLQNILTLIFFITWPLYSYGIFGKFFHINKKNSNDFMCRWCSETFQKFDSKIYSFDFSIQNPTFERN